MVQLRVNWLIVTTLIYIFFLM